MSYQKDTFRIGRIAIKNEGRNNMPKSKREFYRTVIQVEILSEEPLNREMDLYEIANEITDGHSSGRVKTTVDNQVRSGKQMAKLLLEQGSDPEFFRLNEDGTDIEEE